MPTELSRGYRCVAALVRGLMWCVSVKDWRGAENLPEDGGFIAVSNHVTYADPLTFAHYLYNNGHPPRFLAKSPLFDLPVIGRILKIGDQIPVYRGTKFAKDAVRDGVAVLERGDIIAMFPEGTLTRDPNLWPMVARTGVARMALETGAPVVPVAQWGAHRLLARYGKIPRPCPRKRVTMVAGPPIDLDDFRGRAIDTEVLRGATDRIMATLTTMVEDIRGEGAPRHPYDMRAEGGDA